MEKYGFLPVTALQYVSLGNEKFILSGEGPVMKILSHSGGVLHKLQVLPSKRVHGIRLGPQDTKSIDTTRQPVLVFGQKTYRILQLCCDTKFNISVSELSQVYTKQDWILDVEWLMYNSIENFKVAIALAHNCVTIFDSQSNTELIYPSEVNCLLYSAQLKFNNITNDIAVSSGTVFNQILLWNIDKPDPHMTFEPSTPNSVSLILKGHKGVIFGMNFNDDLSQLVSVSDDRSVRIWDIPADWKMKRNHDIQCSHTLYGHTARVWNALWLSSSCVLSISEDATCRVWDKHKGCLQIITGHKGRNIWSVTLDRDNGLVATGGGDCAIRTFDFRKKTTDGIRISELPLPTAGNSKSTTPRLISLRGDDLLCLTENGSILKAHLEDISPDPPLTLTTSFLHSHTRTVWQPLLNDSRFAGYSIMSVANLIPLLALGNLEGLVKIIHLSDTKIMYEWSAHHGKVFSLTWLGWMKNDNVISTTHLQEEILLSCGPDGEMICWRVSIDINKSLSIASLVHLTLPPSKHRWIVSALVISPELDSQQHQKIVDTDLTPRPVCLVCGDRKGSLHVYLIVFDERLDSRAPSNVHVPVQSFQSIHGHNGVTCIMYWKNSLYSTGRDGYCRQFVINPVSKDEWNLLEVNKFHPIKRMDWIDKIHFTEEYGLITLAFHGSDFILFSSALNKPILTFPCGGGHRSYAITPIEETLKTGRVLFSFIKGSSVRVVQEDVSNSLVNSVLQEPFLGREAVSICEIDRNDKGSAILAVGSEDCTIVLVSVQPSVPLSVVRRLEEHISSVKALTSVKSTYNHQASLLISGGGRASLKSWFIYTGTAGLPVSLCCEYNLHHLPPRPQRRKRRMKDISSIPPECRITSLTSLQLCDVVEIEYMNLMKGVVCVVAGCSDGVMRLYIYSEKEKIFSLIDSTDYHKRCILTIHHIVCPITTASDLDSSCQDKPVKPVILCSCATDGHIVFWDLGSVIRNYCQGMAIESDQEESREDGNPSKLKGTSILDSDSVPISQDLGEESILFKPLMSLKTHQSGINDLSLVVIPVSHRSSLLMVASVGDDNALVLTQCNVTSLSTGQSCLKITGKATVLDAHHSTITGVCFLSSEHLLTTSVDQRLTLWTVELSSKDNAVITDKEIILERNRVYLHDVADVAALYAYHIRDKYYSVAICGVGMQSITIQLE